MENNQLLKIIFFLFEMRAVTNKSTIRDLNILKDLQYKQGVVRSRFWIKLIFDFRKTLVVSRKWSI